MEDTGLLNVDNATDIFALHLTFLPRINLALHEYMEAFNHHKVRTANHWSPYQMWVNGMLNEDNPLVRGQLDEDPNDLHPMVLTQMGHLHLKIGTTMLYFLQ